MALRQLALIRETLCGAAPPPGADPAAEVDLDGTPGRGLYDPPAGRSDDYLSLYCEGGLTLVFPTKLELGAWQGSRVAG